jgi:hypothetical protein
MDFLNNIKKSIKEEIDSNVTIKILASLGYTKHNFNYFDNNILKKNFDNIKKNLKIYNINNKFNSEHYFYKDLELIKTNNNSVCIQHKNTKIQKYINKKCYKQNYASLKLKFTNKIQINNIYFPAFKNYIEFIDKENDIYISKYRNSDIKIIFEKIKNHNSYHIHFSFSCDKSNYDNNIKNFIYILKLIYYNNIDFKEL